MNKKVIFPAVAIGTLALAGVIWFGNMQAQAASTNSDTLIDKIAQKFNVPKDQVQATFDEVRTERQQVRKAEQDAKLEQAVKDGVITQEQRDKLVAKRDEMRASRKQNREEMDQWFKDNGIDHSKLIPYMGGGQGGRGHGRNIGSMHQGNLES